MKYYRKRRNFVLLEILIAFGLVALCIFPLVFSQFKVFTAQRQLGEELKKQREANEHFVQFVEQLYKREISLDQIPCVKVRHKESGSILRISIQGNDYYLYVMSQPTLQL